MSAIMRPRRSLIGLSLIEGSCPELEFGTLNPQDGTPAPSSPVDQLARSSPLAPLRAQRTPARAGSFFGPVLPTSAAPQVVGYLGHTGRDDNAIVEAALDLQSCCRRSFALMPRNSLAHFSDSSTISFSNSRNRTASQKSAIRAEVF